MAFLLYDGTFEGFLTVVFECYAQKLAPVDICKETAFQKNLFTEKLSIHTDEQKAGRVWRSLQAKLHRRNKNLPLLVFLSESTGIEMKLYRFIRRIFDTRRSIETDFGDQDVLELKKIERQVLRETMRILQFVRFQQTRDNLFFAPVEPEFDVLPFTINHFRERFADQLWLIYDIKRDYGIFYDREITREVVLSEKTFSQTDGKVSANLLEETEETYQTLWKAYFDHINIPERENPTLQTQHMPRRYWKFLPEKSPIR